VYQFNAPSAGSQIATAVIWAIVLFLLVGALSWRVPAEEATLAQPVSPPSDTHPLGELYSGYRYQPEYVQNIQDSDIKNPGMLWYALGERLWSMTDGAAETACDDCHNLAEKAMRGVGTRYPAFFPPEGRLITLSERINQCRTVNMKARPWPIDSNALLAMETYVRAQSRGMPVRVKTHGPLASFFEAGKAFFYSPRGKLEVSCATCHEDQTGEKLGASTISQGHSNGHPIYKIRAERIEPLHQQFRRCARRMGAEPLSLGAAPYVNLELYLAWRGNGLPVETPAVRE